MKKFNKFYRICHFLSQLRLVYTKVLAAWTGVLSYNVVKIIAIIDEMSLVVLLSIKNTPSKVNLII